MLSAPIAAVDTAELTWRAASLLVALFQPLLWTVLGVGFVLAGVHLISMLATRWGDRRVSGKSLAFSAVMHVSLLIGVLALLPQYRSRWKVVADEEKAIQVRASFSNDAAVTSADSGNAPVWEKLPETPENALSRMTRVLEDVAEPTIQERQRPEQSRPVELTQTDLPPLEDASPEAVEMADAGTPSRAVAELDAADPTAESREEVASPSSPNRERTTDTGSGEQDLPTVAAASRRGGDRSGGAYTPSTRLRSLPAVTSANAALARGDDLMIQRRERPAPSSLPMDAPGRPDARAEADFPQIATPTRAGRPARSADSPAMDDFRPTRTRSGPRRSTPQPSLAGSTLRGFDVPQTGDAPAPQFARASTDALRLDDRSRLPAEYQLRTSDGRLEAARKFGGTKQSEEAVTKALKFLAAAQRADGSWDADAFGAGSGSEAAAQEDRPNVGNDADAGVTALAVLAFLGSGNTHVDGEYRINVEKALRWLISQQRADGYLGGRDLWDQPLAVRNGANSQIVGAYSHAMATFAMAEATAMTRGTAPARTQLLREDWLRRPLEDALSYTVSAQLEDGGWRYYPGQPQGGDMSIFGWQLMSLKSAEQAGLDVPGVVKARMAQFLEDRSRGPANGLAAYRVGDPVVPAMTAEALFCKQQLGLPRSDPASAEAVNYVLARPPRLAEENHYYWYYGTLAMFQYGGDPWRQWNERVRDLLVQEQQADGSWAPRGEWGPYGGRLYSTALAALTLEVYYRYLPLYKDGGQYE